MQAPTISLGPVSSEQWAQYNIREYPLLFNGEKTRAKAIIRGTDLISIAGKGYTLLPNEEALKMANKAADLTGFVPFFENVKDAGWELGHVRGHVLNNNKKTQMHALYVPKDNGGLTDGLQYQGEKVHVGVDVVNSIDGKKSFGIGVFTFRHACKNGVLFGAQKQLSIRHPHTKSLKPVINQLKTLFVEQMDRALMIAEGYKRMITEKATEEMIEKLKKVRIPDKVLPSYLTEDDKKPSENLTTWELYNDVTAGIWHNTSNDLTGKEFQFGQLHRAIPVIKVR